MPQPIVASRHGSAVAAVAPGVLCALGGLTDPADGPHDLVSAVVFADLFLDAPLTETLKSTADAPHKQPDARALAAACSDGNVVFMHGGVRWGGDDDADALAVCGDVWALVADEASASQRWLRVARDAPSASVPQLHTHVLVCAASGESLWVFGGVSPRGCNTAVFSLDLAVDNAAATPRAWLKWPAATPAWTAQERVTAALVFDGAEPHVFACTVDEQSNAVSVFGGTLDTDGAPRVHWERVRVPPLGPDAATTSRWATLVSRTDTTAPLLVVTALEGAASGVNNVAVRQAVYTVAMELGRPRLRLAARSATPAVVPLPSSYVVRGAALDPAGSAVWHGTFDDAPALVSLLSVAEVAAAGREDIEAALAGDVSLGPRMLLRAHLTLPHATSSVSAGGTTADAALDAVSQREAKRSARIRSRPSSAVASRPASALSVASSNASGAGVAVSRDGTPYYASATDAISDVIASPIRGADTAQLHAAVVQRSALRADDGAGQDQTPPPQDASSPNAATSTRSTDEAADEYRPPPMPQRAPDDWISRGRPTTDAERHELTAVLRGHLEELRRTTALREREQKRAGLAPKRGSTNKTAGGTCSERPVRYDAAALNAYERALTQRVMLLRLWLGINEAEAAMATAPADGMTAAAATREAKELRAARRQFAGRMLGHCVTHALQQRRASPDPGDG